ncbi:MAG: 1-acyl-sn-glycerol-3-phosphate acyltransferase [Myxococcales bacterium]|nr:1-acyl-sn-glycerol-3-phosphate acyltransferase [Myxococcales bacterium]
MNPRHIWNAGALGVLTTAYALPGLAMAPFVPVLKSNGPRLTRLARAWSKQVLSACGVSVNTEGFDRPLPDPAYLVISNHTSHFDVLAIYSVFPRDLFPVAKQELAAIPVFGWTLKAGAAIMIDRRDPERAKASIGRAAEAIRSGRSVLMFPEGTRRRVDRESEPPVIPELGVFKKGPFYLALAARVPILPLVVMGAQQVLAPGDWRIFDRTITVRLGSPISTLDYPESGAGRKALSATVHQAMHNLLHERDRP